MFLGPTNGWGWCATWAVFMLPNIEQGPLYNAYNFSIPGDQPANSSIGYSAISVLLCPSDNQKLRPNNPWAPTSYHGNYGGPDVVRMWSGTIVPFYNASSTNNIGAAPGSGWWGADSNLGFFGFESVTDGTSNTALFSEKLLGMANGSPCPTPEAGRMPSGGSSSRTSPTPTTA